MMALEHNEYENVTLRCAFFKDPDDPDPFPQVTWNGPSFDVTNTATQTNSSNYESNVTFSATRQHHGLFTCFVNDVRVGIIKAKFHLTVFCEFPHVQQLDPGNFCLVLLIKLDQTTLSSNRSSH